MDCKTVEDKLSAYLDGELAANEMREIAAHVDTCPACLTELSSLEETAGLLHSLEPVEPPPELTGLIMSRVHELKAGQESARKGLREVFRAFLNSLALRPLGGVAVAVALVVALALGQGVLNLDRHKTSSLAGSGSSAEAPMAPAAVPEMAQPQVFDTAAEPERLMVAPKERAFGPQLPEVQMAMAEEEIAERMVIKTAHLVIRVEELDIAADELTRLVQEQGGFIQNSHLRRGTNWRSANYTVRVPAAAFEDVLDRVQGLGELEQRNIEGQNVTEEYLDVDARRRNLERQEERLLDILERAETVDDILKVEAQLERIRGEIEVLSGRIKYLDNRVNLATLNVELEERPQPVTTVKGFNLTRLVARVREAVTA
ncbi:MAG: DUF4349 domain-containing protein, partial [Firmicutes bacterium]|nr:DUF4349 domain-containing protein [Bacillota bacterium]